MAWTATESFESYADGNNLDTLNGGSGWNGAWAVGSGTWTVSNLQAQGGTLSGRHSTNVADQFAYRPVSSITSGELSYYIRTSATGLSQYINLSASASHATLIKILGGFEATNIVFYDNLTQQTQVTGYNANQWYKIKIKFGEVVDTYKVSIDDGSYSAQYAYYNGGTGAITHCHFYRGGGTADFFFDTIAPVSVATSGKNFLAFM